MSRKHKFLACASIITVLLGGSCAFASWCVWGSHTKDKNKCGIFISAKDSQTSRNEKVLAHLTWGGQIGWHLLSWAQGEHLVKTGYYEIFPEDNAWHIYKKMTRGLQTPVRLVLTNARTTAQLSGHIAKQLMIDSVSVEKALTDSSFCKRYGYSPNTIMALFIPNTYEIYWDSPLDKLMSKMKEENNRFWNTARKEKLQELGLSTTEAYTLASIVDAETANDMEKPMVAGLYINRIRRGMPLQADPTVKYAIGDFSLKRILHKHLSIDSPYNTYLHTGLPPGPIRIASISGIDAVLNYKRHNYIYMCAKEDFSGTHNFASTLAQHNANARRYQKALNRLKIK